jgi:hypothetical protein
VPYLVLDPPGVGRGVGERLITGGDRDGEASRQAQPGPLGLLHQSLKVAAPVEQVVDKLAPQRLFAADGDPLGAFVAVGERCRRVVGSP